MRTLIVGGGIAAQARSEAVREHDRDAELTLVCAAPFASRLHCDSSFCKMRRALKYARSL